MLIYPVNISEWRRRELMTQNCHSNLVFMTQETARLLIIVVRPERFELPTPWFVARYSIQLSYGRIAWRRERDSNPRWDFVPYSLSRGAPSTTRPSLRSVEPKYTRYQSSVNTPMCKYKSILLFIF